MRQSFLATLLLLLILAISSCGGRAARLTKTAARTASLASCPTPIQVVLQRTSTGVPVVNEDVVFRLEVSGCSEQYRLSADAAFLNANAPFFFSRRYTTAGPVRESILVQDANFPTQATTAVAEFTVAPVNTAAIGCQARFSPDVVALGTTGGPQVTLEVRPLNVASSIVSRLTYVAGGGMTRSPSSPVPSAAGSSHDLSIQLNASGQHVVEVELTDASITTRKGTCLAVAKVEDSIGLAYADFPVSQFGVYNPALGPVSKNLMVWNASSGPIALQTVLLASTDFSVESGTCTSLPVLQPLQTCSVIVRFLPVAGPSQRSASLNIHYSPPSASGSIASLSLQGSISVNNSSLSLNPASSINYGATMVGSPVDRTITVNNAGPAPARLGAVVLSNAVFEVASSTCPSDGVLIAGGSCAILVRFTPQSAGSYNSNFILNYTDGSGAPSSVTLVLSGTAEGDPSNIVAGRHFACAIRTGGVKCWGYNAYGQIGDGTKTTRKSPTSVSGLGSGVTAIAAGSLHACAIQNGGVKCWGYNGHGQLGNGTEDDSTAPVPVSGLSSGVTVLAAGGHSTCAVHNGDLKCWGKNEDGQLGDGTDNRRTSPVPVTGGEGVTQVSLSNDDTAPSTHTCAIFPSGVKCWGYNAHRQVGDGGTSDREAPYSVPGLETGVTQVRAFQNRTCVIQNGAMKCWGNNGNGQLGDGTKSDRSVPRMVSGMDQGVTAMGGGGWHTCAVKVGRLLCWGKNTYGTLGDGTTTERLTPVQVSGMSTNVTEVGREGNHFSCAVKQGAYYCWGNNNYGQLGDGTTNDRQAPLLVPNL